MRVPPLLRSRAAIGAALYGLATGLTALPILLIGCVTLAPLVFGYLVVREARAPSMVYAVWAPIFVVAVALICFLLPVLGPAGMAGAVPFFLMGLPAPAFLAILGGLLGSRNSP